MSNKSEKIAAAAVDAASASAGTPVNAFAVIIDLIGQTARWTATLTFTLALAGSLCYALLSSARLFTETVRASRSKIQSATEGRSQNTPAPRRRIGNSH